MTKAEMLDKLIERARIQGALGEALANKDETIVPPFLRERIKDTMKENADWIEHYKRELLA